MPVSLRDLNVSRIADPETGGTHSYQTQWETAYELCADFRAEGGTGFLAAQRRQELLPAR